MMTLLQWAARWNVPEAALKELIPNLPTMPANASTQNLLRVRASQEGGALWRNNSGALKDADGRMIRFGLGNDSSKLNAVWKSSDLIGITSVTWCGRTFGLFTAVEVKHPRWTKPESDRDRAQLAFMTTVRKLGGVATFATHPDHYNLLTEQVK